MQVVENLLVIHNIDESTTQAWDLKLGSQDYNESLLIENCTTSFKDAYLMDIITEEEKTSGDESYKLAKLPSGG